MKRCIRNRKRDDEILWLRNVKGWTFVSIARKYDITKGRVRQVYYRAVADRKREEESNKRMGIGA